MGETREAAVKLAEENKWKVEGESVYCQGCQANRKPIVTLKIGNGIRKSTGKFATAFSRIVSLWRTKYKFDARIINTLEPFATEVAIVIGDVYPDSLNQYEAAWVFIAEMQDEIDADVNTLSDAAEEAQRAWHEAQNELNRATHANEPAVDAAGDLPYSLNAICDARFDETVCDLPLDDFGPTDEQGNSLQVD